MPEMIPIDAKKKEKIQELRETYQRLTNENPSSDQDKADGIYPIHITDALGQERMRGVRLGEAEPKTHGSVCMNFGVHTNEPAGFAAAKVVLDKWKNDKLKNINRDIYLLFSGDFPKADAFFERMLRDDQSSISVEELTGFRLTEDGTNRNRLPRAEEMNKSQKDLLAEYMQFNEIYKKCDGGSQITPGFCIGFHTLSQEAPITIGMPWFAPYSKEPEAYAKELDSVRNRVGPFFQQLGADHVVLETTNNLYTDPQSAATQDGESYFEGACPIENGKVPKNSAIRATFECGSHLDENSFSNAEYAALKALEYLSPDLSLIRNRQPKSMWIGDKISLLYPPASSREDPMGWKPNLKDDEKFGDMHLITGNELTPNQKETQEMPLHFKDLGEDIKQALCEAKKDQLANGAMLKRGQCIGYVDIYNKNDDLGSLGNLKPLKRALMYAPLKGAIFMAPRDPKIPYTQQEAVCEMTESNVEILPLSLTSEKIQQDPRDMSLSDAVKKPVVTTQSRSRTKRILSESARIIVNSVRMTGNAFLGPLCGKDDLFTLEPKPSTRSNQGRAH